MSESGRAGPAANSTTDLIKNQKKKKITCKRFSADHGPFENCETGNTMQENYNCHSQDAMSCNTNPPPPSLLSSTYYQCFSMSMILKADVVGDALYAV